MEVINESAYKQTLQQLTRTFDPSNADQQRALSLIQLILSSYQHAGPENFTAIVTYSYDDLNSEIQFIANICPPDMRAEALGSPYTEATASFAEHLWQMVMILPSFVQDVYFDLKPIKQKPNTETNLRLDDVIILGKNASQVPPCNTETEIDSLFGEASEMISFDQDTELMASPIKQSHHLSLSLDDSQDDQTDEPTTVTPAVIQTINVCLTQLNTGHDIFSGVTPHTLSLEDKQYWLERIQELASWYQRDSRDLMNNLRQLTPLENKLITLVIRTKKVFANNSYIVWTAHFRDQLTTLFTAQASQLARTKTQTPPKKIPSRQSGPYHFTHQTSPQGQDAIGLQKQVQTIPALQLSSLLSYQCLIQLAHAVQSSETSPQDAALQIQVIFYGSHLADKFLVNKINNIIGHICNSQATQVHTQANALAHEVRGDQASLEKLLEKFNSYYQSILVQDLFSLLSKNCTLISEISSPDCSEHLTATLTITPVCSGKISRQMESTINNLLQALCRDHHDTITLVKNELSTEIRGERSLLSQLASTLAALYSQAMNGTPYATQAFSPEAHPPEEQETAPTTDTDSKLGIYLI